MQSNYIVGKSRPRWLCRWWLRTRLSHERIRTLVDELRALDTDGVNITHKDIAIYEFYVPLWAKPLDFIWCLIFGKPILSKD